MKIGFIGTGNMGGAILKGYARSEASEGNGILIHDKLTEHNEEMAKAIGESGNHKVEVCNDNESLCAQSDIIIIGVKPQVIEEVLKEIAPVFGDNDKIVISMAAGVSISTIEKYLGSTTKIIRIMPNTPALVGEAMVAMAPNANVSRVDFANAKAIFDSIGVAEEVDEELIDCVIGVSGSSPAYTYMYIEALVKAAEKNGMSSDKARTFAAQAVLGAARMVLSSRESLEQLRINVCSPGGTTIEAVNALMANGFMDDVIEGFQAAVDRSIEMTKEKESK